MLDKGTRMIDDLEKYILESDLERMVHEISVDNNQLCGTQRRKLQEIDERETTPSTNSLKDLIEAARAAVGEIDMSAHPDTLEGVKAAAQDLRALEFIFKFLRCRAQKMQQAALYREKALRLTD